PVMDGMTALQKIMAKYPLPVVMLSSVTNEGAAKTAQAIAGGAVDFIEKPSGTISLDLGEMKQEIINTDRIAYEAKLIRSKESESAHAPFGPGLLQRI